MVLGDSVRLRDMVKKECYSFLGVESSSVTWFSSFFLSSFVDPQQVPSRESIDFMFIIPLWCSHIYGFKIVYVGHKVSILNLFSNMGTVFGNHDWNRLFWTIVYMLLQIV